MKIFAIRDDNDISNKDLAYLVCYEKENRFYIEIPEGIDEWEAPLLISSFVERGIKRLDAYWSKLWVKERVIPSDRQNLGDILKDNNMEFYNEYQLLVLAKGRCAQDDYYIHPISENELPYELKIRMDIKVDAVVPLGEHKLLVFFKNGKVKKCDLKEKLKESSFIPIRVKENFESVKVDTGGYGICWGENIVISNEYLYEIGEEVPLSKADFEMFVKNNVVNSAEATVLLSCSRQNINDLLKRGKLKPVKSTLKNHLFLKSDIIKRNW